MPYNFVFRDHTPNKNATPEEKGMQREEGNYQMCARQARLNLWQSTKSQRYSLFPIEI